MDLTLGHCTDSGGPKRAAELKEIANQRLKTNPGIQMSMAGTGKKRPLPDSSDLGPSTENKKPKLEIKDETPESSTRSTESRQDTQLPIKEEKQ